MITSRVAIQREEDGFLGKRFVDLMVAFCCLALLLPVFALVAGWIMVVSPGPVLFRQERVGFRGRRFIMLKFRSMGPHAETQSHEEHVRQIVDSDTPMEKLDSQGDPRVIRGGRFLRASCLDELPQLLNVVRGEMSLVGPRPCVPSEFELYSDSQKERFDVKPGLTGYWQVTGKNKTTFSEMVAMDIYYVKSMSLWLDLKIMFRTIPTIWGQVMDTATTVKSGEAREGF